MTFDEIARSELLGKELASVTFVRDYMQLGFDGPTLTLVGELSFGNTGEQATPNEVVALIDQEILGMDCTDARLAMTFGNGATLVVSFGSSPELGSYHSDLHHFIFN